MDDGIPDDFDVVVIGTGLPESILASACARIGLTVLHLDSNEYYGDCWASFNLEQLIKWVEDCNSSLPSSSDAIDETLESHEKLLAVRQSRQIFSNVVFRWNLKNECVPEEKVLGSEQSALREPAHQSDEKHEPEHQPDEKHEREHQPDEKHEREHQPDERKWSKEKLLRDWRRFSIDLTPKVALSRGDLVNLLIDSNVGRYAEFKTVDRILTYLDKSLKIVPCSRSDVFQSGEINMIEKRMLMKFLMFCLNYEQSSDGWQDYRGKSFETFLNAQNLTPQVRHYILNALAMVSAHCPTEEGLKAVNEFLMSTGRYGSSPFLWTVYGSGELPQCFCRLCAVFGGVYCLRRDVDALIVDKNDNRISSVISNKRKINCRNVVSNMMYLPVNRNSDKNCNEQRLSRAVLITDRSLVSDGKEHISLLNVRFGHLPEPVKLLEVGHNGMVCPSCLYVVHLTTLAKTSAEADFGPVIEEFFSSDDENCLDRPLVLASLYFNQILLPACESDAQTVFPSNLIVTGLPDRHLDYDAVVNQVREQFKAHFPDAPFLEPRPDQDEEGVVETDDPGINGFTPDPEPAHQSTRSDTTENAEKNVCSEDNL